MAGLVLILMRWLIAGCERATARINLEWSIASGKTAGRRFAWCGVRRSIVPGLPFLVLQLPAIPWMTYCLGRGWTNGPYGLQYAPVRRVTAPLSKPLHRWGCRDRLWFIDNNQLLTCSQRVPVCRTTMLGTGGHSSDFSMPAYAADR